MPGSFMSLSLILSVRSIYQWKIKEKNIFYFQIQHMPL